MPKNQEHRYNHEAFTIVEVVLALGVIAGGLLVIFGLIPDGLAAARTNVLRFRGYQLAQYVQASLAALPFADAKLGNQAMDLANVNSYTFYTNSDAGYSDSTGENSLFSNARASNDNLKMVIKTEPHSTVIKDPVSGLDTSVVTSSTLQITFYEVSNPDIRASFGVTRAKVDAEEFSAVQP